MPLNRPWAEPEVPDRTDPVFMNEVFSSMESSGITPEQVYGEDKEAYQKWLNKKWVQSIAKKFNAVHEPGGTPEGGEFASATEAILTTLRTGAVKSNRILGGGVNKTRKLVLEDGTKAVFKPHDGEAGGYRDNISDGFQTEREVGAWEVAKIVGLHDMVAPAVVRDIKGSHGAMLAWQEGGPAFESFDDRKYDGDKDLGRAAAFDFVIGNEDRHEGNWIVSHDIVPKLHLIDHGLSFPDKDKYNINDADDYFIKEAKARFDDDRPVGKVSTHQPSDFAKPYVEGKEKIVKALTTLGLPPGAIKGVEDRIDILSKSSTWGWLRPRKADFKIPA